ncbi:MAG: secondary thiamine-phosphate synthase enzyme YjbQ [Gaiellaceae bacterium]
MHEIRVRTTRRSHVVDITARVTEAVTGERGGAVLVYVPHTTAGVTINEHVDPELVTDLEGALERVVPDDWSWRHDDQDGPNAPSHVRAALIGSSVTIPLREDGSLALGTWQGIFFCEFDGPRDRSVYVSVLR